MNKKKSPLLRLFKRLIGNDQKDFPQIVFCPRVSRFEREAMRQDNYGRWHALFDA